MSSIFARVDKKVGVEQIINKTEQFYTQQFSFEIHRSCPEFIENEIFSHKLFDQKKKKKQENHDQSTADFIARLFEHLRDKTCDSSMHDYFGQSNVVSSLIESILDDVSEFILLKFYQNLMSIFFLPTNSRSMLNFYIRT